jgi:hypothetical protein
MVLEAGLHRIQTMGVAPTSFVEASVPGESEKLPTSSPIAAVDGVEMVVEALAEAAGAPIVEPLLTPALEASPELQLTQHVLSDVDIAGQAAGVLFPRPAHRMAAVTPNLMGTVCRHRRK